MNKPTDEQVVGMLEDLGKIATSSAIELGNNELFITEQNASDWYALHKQMGEVYDKLMSLVERSKEAPPCPPEYIPIYGVSNGRGRIIA